MFSKKNKYYFIIENTKDINLKKIKKRGKFKIIYRNLGKSEIKKDLLKFRRECKLKSIGFYVANNLRLAIDLSSDGIYLSSFNKSFKALSVKKKNFQIIGSAHSQKDIFEKNIQGCQIILFSKLFIVDYDKKAPFLGIVKFNNFLNRNVKLIPLGGINLKNLNKLKQIKCEGFALKSELKKSQLI